MKTIGMLGGMSWESTAHYYRLINEGIKEALGGLHSGKILLHGVDFAEIEQLQHQGKWDQAGQVLANAARSLELAGADGVMICTNTMHKVAPVVEQALSIPLLHIADATAQALVKAGVSKVGLMGTAFTMEQDFYKGRLVEKYALDVLIPDDLQRTVVHDIIYNELCLGSIQDASRQAYIDIIHNLTEQGAKAIILGCTEIGLLVQQEHVATPLFDTTAIHAAEVVRWMLESN
ncbi:aspartate/glutamate racemase family protein [Endozoicomonas ascidiicola]|uniref:aspartate/glutamate racemase family protein n=1 Tax=Endozoicomonas ascidiicola TaxID=1698521 RepID=UPI00082B0C06|nr:aspartate/glutamate racemase family protein [Endozoicomonas ascidiicola]